MFGQEPELRTLFEELAETGPLLVRLCGSGSAVIALYKSERDREAAALRVGRAERQLIETHTRAHPAPAPQDL